jgi:hypothetical protein
MVEEVNMIDTTQKNENLSTKEQAGTCLAVMATSEIPTSDGNVKESIELLFKIVNNILGNPMEQKFRKIPKKSQALQKKVLRFPSAVAFLKICGFEESADDFQLLGFNNEHLAKCSEAIADFVKQMGGKVQDPNAFDPYKACVSSSTGSKPLTEVLKVGGSGATFKHQQMD